MGTPWNRHPLWPTPSLNQSMLCGTPKSIQTNCQGTLVTIFRVKGSLNTDLRNATSYSLIELAEESRSDWTRKCFDQWPLDSIPKRNSLGLDCSAFKITRPVIFQRFDQYLLHRSTADVSVESRQLHHWATDCLSLFTSLLSSYFGELDTTEWPVGSTYSECSRLWMTES